MGKIVIKSAVVLLLFSFVFHSIQISHFHQGDIESKVAIAEEGHQNLHTHLDAEQPAAGQSPEAEAVSSDVMHAADKKWQLLLSIILLAGVLFGWQTNLKLLPQTHSRAFQLILTRQNELLTQFSYWRMYLSRGLLNPKTH